MSANPVAFPSREWTTLQVRVRVSAKKINTNPDVTKDIRSSTAESLGEIDPGNENTINALVQLLSNSNVDYRYRPEALINLAQKLPPELLPEALAAAREIQSGEYCPKALSSLAQKLPPELLSDALAAAREIQDEEYRAEALSSLAQKLPSE